MDLEPISASELGLGEGLAVEVDKGPHTHRVTFENTGQNRNRSEIRNFACAPEISRQGDLVTCKDLIMLLARVAQQSQNKNLAEQI
eukprot:5650686-Pyramimonas_sp.AAC.1